MPCCQPTVAYIEYLSTLTPSQRQANITRAVNNLRNTPVFAHYLSRYDDQDWDMLAHRTDYFARTHILPANMASHGRRWFYLN